MNLKITYLLFLILCIGFTCFSQNESKMIFIDSVALHWNPIKGKLKILDYKVNRSKTVKGYLNLKPENTFNKTLIKIVPDTISRAKFDSPSPMVFTTSARPFVPNKILKATPFLFKDNATKNITYQDLTHGFYSNSISGLTQDKDGFIWIGSENEGLCKYDGFHYEMFDKSSFLPSNTIKELFCDKTGVLWICTDSGICYLKDNKIHQINFENINSININSIIEDNNGAIWISTEKQGLFKIENNTYTNISKLNGLPSNIAKGIYHDKNGNYWVGFDEKQGFISLNDNIILHYKPDDGLPIRMLSVGYEDQNGLWAGLTEGGVLQIKNDSIWQYDFFNPKYDNIYSFNKNNQGYWFNIYGRGIINLKNSKFEFLSPKDGLAGRHVYKIFIDNKNNIWEADLSEGIGRVNENVLTVSKRHQLNSVPKIIKGLEDDIWFATNGGILTKETEDGNFITYYNKPDNENPRAYYIFDLAFRKNGEMWGATYGLGCIKFSEKEFVFYSFPELGQGNILFSSKKDNKDNLWFTSRDNGLIKYDGSKFYLLNETNGLINNKTSNLFLDSKGKLWIGTNNGLSVIENDKIASIDELKDTNVNSFYEDSNNTIWIGTVSSGVFVYKNNCLYNINEENGILSNSISSIFKDSKGRFWIATKKGISRLKFHNDDTYEIRNFGLEFGPFLTQFSQAVHEYQDGTIIWGSNNKIVKYSPDRERLDLESPKLLLKNYYIENKLYEFNESDTTIDIAPNKALKINYTALDWGYENQITFDYALSYKNESVQKWISLERKTNLELKNIPTGEYQLFIRAKGANGTTISSKILVSFLPFWWETLWFKSSILGLFLICFYLFYKWRTHLLVKRQYELQEAVTNKTAVIESEKEKLKNRNSVIENQKKEIEILLEEVNHRVKNNLTMLTSLFYFQEKKLKSKEAKEALKDGINRIKAISIIHEKLHGYDSSTKFNFRLYIENLIQSIQNSLNSNLKNITTHVECDNIQMDISKSVYLGLIINELITNSYKYAFNNSEEGIIGVSMNINNEGLYVLKVYDNGIGLKINWRDDHIDSTGIKLVKLLSKQIDAKMRYNNLKFSTFIFVFEK